MAIIGERIAELRDSLGLTQAAMAKKIMVSRSYLSEVEAGKGKPSLDMIVGIATFYPHVRIEWLLTGDGQMFRRDGEKRDYATDNTKIAHAGFDSVDNDNRQMSDIRWPLTSDQEYLLEHYDIAPQFFSQATELFYHLSREEMWESRSSRIPYAFSRQWVNDVIGYDISRLFIYLVRNGNMEPFLSIGSQALVTHEDGYKNGYFTREGIYLMLKYEGGDGIFFLAYIKSDCQGVINIAVSRPDIEQSFRKVHLSEEPISYVGRVVWVGKRI